MSRGVSHPPTSAALARARRALPAWLRAHAHRDLDLRSRLTTTPGRLRLASVMLVVGVVALWIAGAVTLDSRRTAARDVGLEAAPGLLRAQELYVALADADATASRAFLEGGDESPQIRERYLGSLEAAADNVAAIGSEGASSPDTAEAVQTITAQLPVYAGRVEAARANSRQGLPVGAAYLRQASTLMRDEILPEATRIYRHQLERLDADYANGRSSTGIIWVAGLGFVVVAGLVAMQIRLSGRTKRTLNPCVVTATACVVLVLGWTAMHFDVAAQSLDDARRDGSDPAVVLSTARILALRAASDSTLALVERGTGEAYLADFATVRSLLEGRDGLFGAAAEVAPRAADARAIGALRDDYRAFVHVHDEVQQQLAVGEYAGAVTLSLGRQSEAASRLDAGLGNEIVAARARLSSSAADARAGFDTLALGMTVLVLAAAVLLLAGLQLRIREYR